MIQIENLCFSYSRKQMLFDQLSVQLPAGNIYGLLGKNGAGKSTLLYLITGLLFPKKVVWMSCTLSQKPCSQFLREIYLVTEEFSLPSMKMERFVSLYSPFYPRFNHSLLDEYLNEFNLPRDKNLQTCRMAKRRTFYYRSAWPQIAAC